MLKTSRKGFTLIEMMTVMFLGVLIVAASWSVYLMTSKIHKRNFESTEITQNARIALERMSRDIRQATEIVTTLPTGSTGAPSFLKFQDGHNFIPNPNPSGPVPSPSPSPSTNKIQYIEYYLSGTDLYRKKSHFTLSDPNVWVSWTTAGATEVEDENFIKAQNITKLQFWGNNTITIYLEVSNSTSTYSFETQSYPRNIQ